MKELKNGRSMTVECDGRALKGIFFAKNFEAQDIAQKLEYQGGYFSKVFSRNRIGIKCVRMLYEKFGISPQSYGVVNSDQFLALDTTEKTVKEKVLEKKGAKKSEQQTIVLQAQIDIQQLKQLVREAVAEAFDNL